ncbi:MAG: hypothetical protein COA93_03800 [Alphaproteobacteria bacterium]|nr:MAG: hypothetical protein COA93_03800 [Alphaproteobacteria bacterium]
MKRYALTLKIPLVLFSLLALVIILLGWRLSIGPIALDWAGDYLKRALVLNQKDVSFDFRDAVLVWRKKEAADYGRTSGLQVTFYEVEIIDKKTDFILNVPEAGMRFSGLAMMRGLLAPTDIEIFGLSIDYTFGPDVWTSTDNRPFMEKLEALIEELQNSEILPFKIAKELLSPPKTSVATGYLGQFSLLGTKITLTDQLSGQIWQIPEAHLNLRRTSFGLNVRMLGNIEMPQSNAMPIDVSLVFDNARKEVVTSLHFSELRPAALVGKVDALSGLSNLDIPAKGKIDFTIDRDFKIPVMTFSISLDEGTINPTEIYPEPLKITSAALSGYVNRSEDTIFLEEISLQLGQTYVSGTGMLYGPTDRPGIAIKADITDLPFADLKTYWPGRFGKGAYDWIAKNIDAGIVPKGKLDVYIEPQMWPSPQNNAGLPADSVTFKFDFKNISAHYLRPMPILSGMSGHAELNLQSFHLKAGGGYIEQLVINRADLLFSDIHIKGKGVADITLELEGTLEEILRVIDHKPLGYPSKYGIKQGSITGQATAELSLSFPLLKKVRLKDVTFDVKADIHQLSIPVLNDSLGINDGDLQLFVNGDGITAEGNIILNGVAFTANWLENFGDSEDFPTKYIINGFIEGAQWEQLHLPFDPYIDGPVEIDLTLYGKGGAIKKGNGQFNLINSLSNFDPIGWEKPKGKAGHVDFDLTFKGDGHLTISNILLQSESLVANLELDMVDDMVTRFSIPSLVMSDTDIKMLMQWDAEKKYYASTITGKAFNAASLIDIIMSTDSDEEKVSLPDFNVEAEIDDLLAKNNVRISKVILSAIYRKQDFTHVNLEGKIHENNNVTVSVYPEGDNRKLLFNSDDAGEALRGLGVFNLGVGGDMTLNADMVKHEHGISLGGQAKITKFKVIESPGFSKLLDEKKFIKAREELNKGGLSFNNFDMTFRTSNGVMEISDARARGPMLGMTIEGVIDQVYDEMNISGTLVPAYGINSLLGNIPLIGTILTGGKGEGIFSATYTISGPLDDPQININPLAVLAPGIFRKIFTAIGGKKKTLREQAEEMQKIIPNTKSTSGGQSKIKPEPKPE